MRVVHAGVCAIVVALTASVLAQRPSGPRRDGNWEVTMEMQMPNMPAGMAMPPMKTTQCITKADAADPAKAMPSSPQRGGQGTGMTMKYSGKRLGDCEK